MSQAYKNQTGNSPPSGSQEPYKTTLRHLATLQLIPRRSPGHTSQEIQERLSNRDFDVSLRQVQRDLNMLSLMFPVQSDESRRPYRWHWTPGGPDLSLPEHDAFSALSWDLIETHLKHLLPPSVQREAAPRFRSARAYLRNSSSHRLQHWRKRIRVIPRTMPFTPPPVDAGVLEAVYESLWQNRQLQVEYRRRGAAGPRSMSVHPLGMVIREGVIYLVVTVDNHDEIRQLSLHRIPRARVGCKRAHTPAGFDLDEYIAKGAFSHSRGETIRLVARFEAHAAQHLIDSPMARDQQHHELHDGRIEFQASVLDSEQLRWWLLGFGEHVEVIRPVSLRRYMAGQASKLSERYAGLR